MGVHGLNAAFSVQIVQAEQELLRDLLDERHGDTTVVPALNKTQKILAQDFENHAHMRAIWAFMLEAIQ